MSKEELAWAGGFFTGEGCSCLHIHKTRKERPYPFMTVNQSSVEELERFNAALGNIGKINGPHYGRSKLGKKPLWVCNIYGWEKMTKAVEMLWPYLSTKKQEQAKRVLDGCKGYYENSISRY